MSKIMPIRAPRIDVQGIIPAVMWKWDEKKDTYQIALELGVDESLVCKALAAGREARREQQ